MAHAGYARTSWRRRLVGHVEALWTTNNEEISLCFLARCHTKKAQGQVSKETLQIRESDHSITRVDKAIVVGNKTSNGSVLIQPAAHHDLPHANSS